MQKVHETRKHRLCLCRTKAVFLGEEQNKKRPKPYGFRRFVGGRYRTRTYDPLHVKQVL